jgi:hypothetical protein
MDAVVLCVLGDFGNHAAIGAIPLRFIKQGPCQVKAIYRVGSRRSLLFKEKMAFQGTWLVSDRPPTG